MLTVCLPIALRCPTETVKLSCPIITDDVCVAHLTQDFCWTAWQQNITNTTLDCGTCGQAKAYFLSLGKPTPINAALECQVWYGCRCTAQSINVVQAVGP